MIYVHKKTTEKGAIKRYSQNYSPISIRSFVRNLKMLLTHIYLFYRTNKLASVLVVEAHIKLELKKI